MYSASIHINHNAAPSNRAASQSKQDLDREDTYCLKKYKFVAVSCTHPCTERLPRVGQQQHSNNLKRGNRY